MSDEKLKSLIELYKTSDDTISKPSRPEWEPLIKALLASRNKSEKENLSFEEKAELLRKRYLAFSQQEVFEPGELVKWKPGLRNKGGLGYGDVAIVVDVFQEPIFDTKKDSGSPYFREPLDLSVAFLDSDNDFIVLHVDSRRIRHAPEP